MVLFNSGGILYNQIFLGHVAVLVMSHMNGLKPFERTIERTIETITTSSKTITAAARATNRITSLQELLHYRFFSSVLLTILFPFQEYGSLENCPEYITAEILEMDALSQSEVSLLLFVFVAQCYKDIVHSKTPCPVSVDKRT